MLRKYGFIISTVVLLSILVLIRVEYGGKKDVSPPFPRVRSVESPHASKEMKDSRWAYFQRLLRDPVTGEIPADMRQKELEYARTLPHSSYAGHLRKGMAAASVAWQEAGPNDVGGRTRALVVDATNSNTILAGGVSGGIWKSTNNGASWVLKNSPTHSLSVTSLAQDTRTGYTGTWYYATGEFVGNSASDRGYMAVFRGTGIYKSTDNGETWNVLPNTETLPTTWNSAYNYVTRIVVSPTTGYVFAASNGLGIFRSTDGGSNFSLVHGGTNDQYYCDVVVASNGTLVASLSEYGYNPVAGRADQPGIYKSTNNGDNWTDITPTTFPAAHERTVLATAPSDADVVYALTNTGGNVGQEEDIRFHKITISTGASVDRSVNLPNYGGTGNFNTQGNYNMVVAVKPDDANFVILGVTNLFRSADGFATTPADKEYTWIGGYHWDSDKWMYPNQHADQHVIAFDPADAKKMWCGHDGGLSYTTDITTVSTSIVDFPWLDKNKGYNVTQFYTVAMQDAAGNNQLMGGTQDNGTPFFIRTTTTSASTDISTGDGAYAYFGDSFAYTSSQLGRVLRLSYYGNGNPQIASNWSDITPSNATNQLFINPFTVDPSNEDYMYYLTQTAVWRNNQLNDLPMYLNGTTTGWSQLSNLTVPAGYSITALAVSRQNSASVLYYGASPDASTNPARIYRFENATSATDGEVERILPASSNGGYVHRIAINPANSNEILVVLSNYRLVGLYHSSDGGQNFTAVEGNLEGNLNNGPSLRSATILPLPATTIYFLGTSTGVYSTTLLNGSSTVWSQEGADEIGNVVVEDITSRTSDYKVAAGTHGRGIFIATYSPAEVGAENSSGLPDAFQLSQNYPNPFNPATNIEYTIPVAQHVVLKVYDMLGKEVDQIINADESAGAHKIQYQPQSLASGVYVYMITAGPYRDAKKFVLIR
jgi:hypothetical protein